MATYKLENLDCAECAANLEKAVSELKAVKFVSIDFATLSMKIDAGDMRPVEETIHNGHGALVQSRNQK